MKLRHVFAAILIIGAIAFVSTPGDAVEHPVYLNNVPTEEIARPGELIYDDEPAVCEAGSCKSSRKGLFSRKPLRKAFKKLRCK